MKILIVTQYFWPEEFRINDLALNLIKRGHKISVLTGNPNYPKGKFTKGYGFKFSTELYEGIKIHRVPVFPRGKSKLMLILNYFSFILFGGFFALFHKEKYDKVFALNYSPITAIIPGMIYCKKNRIELAIWVQDLWPESVAASGSVDYKGVNILLLPLVKFIYRKSDKIFVSNIGFKKSIIKKGVSSNKLFFMPNWAEDLYEQKKNNNKSRQELLIPQGFIIMFAGNLGNSQDFESIIEAIELTKKNSIIKWVFVGDGRKRNWFENEIRKRKLDENVKLLGRFPMEKMPDFFTYADIMLVSLKDEYIFSLTVPGKMQSYMAFSKPILTMITGAGNELVKKAKCGLISDAGDFKRLAKNAIKASNLPTQILLEWGVNGNKIYNEHFAKNKVIDNFLRDFSIN